MLPFQKRSVQGHQADDISTEDVVEVVHKVRQAANVALSSHLGSTLRSNEIPAKSSRRHASDRPRTPAPVPASTRMSASRVAPQYSQEDEEEMTCLMPAKGLIIPPPVSSPVQTRRPPPMGSVMSSNTSFRPAPSSKAPSSQAQAPMYSSREATPYDARSAYERRAPRTPQPMAVLAASRQETGVVPAAPASLAPMAMPSVDSEPHINPGATVLTARTLKGRPTASWAAALVAMGIFAGLVTAAVARGDFAGSQDMKVAAASQVAGDQVIPSQHESLPASSPALPSFAPVAAAPMAISSPVAATGIIASEPVPVAAKFAPTPRAAAPKSAPVAHVSKPAAPAAEKSEPKAEAKSDVKEEKKEKVASKGKKDKDGDMASAKEAQALADAQLAASL